MIWSEPEDETVRGAFGGRLLVVDDDEANRDLLSRRLTRKGHDVLTADSGPTALELVSRRPFDVVLLDVMMPGMSGLDTLTALRRLHGPTALPVIMATARDQSEDIVEALRLGANDYVTKPLDFPVVLARLQTQLAMKRAIDQAAQLEARLAERNQELEALNERLKGANRRMARDLEAAARVQESFLPGLSPALPGASCSWAYRPCEQLAGDGLNAFPLDDRRSALYVFDVCGHGVASALLSVSLSRVLSPPGDPSSVLGRRQRSAGAAEVVTPVEVADHLNRMFPFDQAEQFFTLVYGILDSRAGTFRYVSAGHPGLIVLPAQGPPALFDGRGYPVGLAGGQFEEQELSLAPGDRLFLYSDGIIEAADSRGEIFGTARLLDVIAEGRARPLPAATEGVVAAIEGWAGDVGLRDDVSLLAVTIEGAGRDADPEKAREDHPSG